MTTTEQQMDLGTELRDQALAQVSANTDPTWRAAALNGLQTLAATGDVFEAYDLIRLGVPEPRHSSCWGALFKDAAHAGVITAAGAGPSTRPTVRRSLTRFWRGTPLAQRSTGTAPCPDCAAPVVRPHPVGRPPRYCPPCGARRAHSRKGPTR